MRKTDKGFQKVQMNKYILIAIICCSFVEIYAQEKSLDSCDIQFKKALTAFASYEQFWRRDTLGRNGVRWILAQEFFKKPDCFIGKSWAQLELYLGSPLYLYKAHDTSSNGSKGKATYRYPILTPRGFYE